MNLAKAIKIASVAFESKTDKGSNPYILHCLHVMNEVKHYGEFTMICAVLHDLIEDTNWTKEDLIKENFGEFYFDLRDVINKGVVNGIYRISPF